MRLPKFFVRWIVRNMEVNPYLGNQDGSVHQIDISLFDRFVARVKTHQVDKNVCGYSVCDGAHKAEFML